MFQALKESFLKAIGVGIGFNLQRIEFNVSPLQLEIGKVYKETKMLLDGDKEEEWTFEVRTIQINFFNNSIWVYYGIIWLHCTFDFLIAASHLYSV